LKPFGLAAAKLQLTNDLEVSANQTQVVDATDQKFAKQVSRLTPETIGDLKTWIGVPDAAFAQPTAIVAQPRTIIPVRESYGPEHTKAFYALARNYIFGHSATVSRAQLPALNKWIATIAGSLGVIVFQDIHVAANATLVLNPSIVVLFARYITIDLGGMIKVRCTYGSINCAGIKGVQSPVVGPITIRPPASHR
jgi:hypothetical protein